VVEPEQFVGIQEMLFRKLCEAIVSPAFQIVEKVFQLWHHEYILNLIAANIEVILPIVFPSLYSTAKNHWNKAIRGMAANDIRLLMDIDTVVFGRVLQNYKSDRLKEKEDREKRVNNWRSLFEIVEPKKLQPPGKTDSSDPLLYDNEGLPESVKIPHHLNLVSIDEFDANEQFFKELDRLCHIRINDTMNKKLRQKEMLPMDRMTYEAIAAHEPLDRDVNGNEPDGGDATNNNGQSDDGSGFSYSQSDYSSDSDGDGSDSDDNQN